MSPPQRPLSAASGHHRFPGTRSSRPPGRRRGNPSGSRSLRRRPPGPTVSPIFRTGINFVRVDVIVTDKNGKPVGDLKPDDFEVIEEGKPQTIETFKLVSLDGGLMASTKEPPRAIRTDDDEESEAARDDVRLFAIFLDDYHVAPRDEHAGARAARAIRPDAARPDATWSA